MFRVVTPPIIRNTYNCNHSIWNSCSTTAEGNRDGLTSTRCCDYSYMCSWWWVELPPETCRASSLQKSNKLYIVASRTFIHNVPMFDAVWPRPVQQAAHRCVCVRCACVRARARSLSLSLSLSHSSAHGRKLQEVAECVSETTTVSSCTNHSF